MVKLFALPVLLWAITAWMAPELALSVLLLSGVSTVVTAPFIATILDASPNHMLQVMVLTSVLVPLTLPGLVSLLMGQSLEIPYSQWSACWPWYICLPTCSSSCPCAGWKSG